MPQRQGADATEPVRAGRRRQSGNYGGVARGEFLPPIDLIVISCWGRVQAQGREVLRAPVPAHELTPRPQQDRGRAHFCGGWRPWWRVSKSQTRESWSLPHGTQGHRGPEGTCCLFESEGNFSQRRSKSSAPSSAQVRKRPGEGAADSTPTQTAFP